MCTMFVVSCVLALFQEHHTVYNMIISGKTHKLKTLKMILSTGSPLKPQSYDYVYREIKKDLLLASISGTHTYSLSLSLSLALSLSPLSLSLSLTHTYCLSLSPVSHLSLCLCISPSSHVIVIEMQNRMITIIIVITFICNSLYFSVKQHTYILKLDGFVRQCMER